MIDLDIHTMPLVFIDVETTGFSATKNRIIEFAAVRFDDGEITGKLVSFINPECEVPEVITGITGITDVDVRYAPLFRAIVPQVRQILDGAIMVAHNAKFDYGFIKEEFGRAGVPFSAITLCTCELAKALCPRLVNHKLQTIIETYKFEVSDRHRAYDDAMVLPQFLKQLRVDVGDELLRETSKKVLV